MSNQNLQRQKELNKHVNRSHDKHLKFNEIEKSYHKTNFCNKQHHTFIFLRHIKHFRVLLFLFIFLFSQQAWATNFVITVKTDNVGTSNATSFMLPMVGGNFDVDWENDSVFDDIGVSGSQTHDYGVAGIYTIAVRKNAAAGSIEQIQFNNLDDRLKLLTIEQWGTDAVWTAMNNAFYGCSNLTINAIDSPDLSSSLDLFSMFRATSSLTDLGPGGSSWDISNVTSLASMFSDAVVFNQDISSWNTSNVTNMAGVFNGASLFNQDIGGWDTGVVNIMRYMFADAISFDQNLGGWDVEQMNNGANFMFSNVTLSTANYDALLIGWSAQALATGSILDGGNSNYCAGESARTSMIVTDFWTITDGGLNCGSPGGIATNLTLWLKADAGVTTTGSDVNTWADQSSVGNDFIDVGQTPDLVTDTLNFNPGVQFNPTGNNSGWLRSSGFIPPTTAFTFFEVIDSITSTTSNDTIFSYSEPGGADNGNGLFMQRTGGTSFSWMNSGTSFTTGSNLRTQPSMFVLDYEESTALGNERVNGLANAGNSFTGNSGALTTGGTAHLGTEPDGGETTNLANYLRGIIPEVIFYSSVLSVADRNQVESYLALKYGLTLDQSTAQDYTASDGTTEMWNKDATGASTFNNDIFGIGRDDGGQLGQLKSKSVNTDAIITLLAEGESTDDSNTPANYNFTDIADLEFLTIGNNDGAATWTSTGAPTGYQILTRQWSVQETGDVGTVQLDFDVADGDFDVPAVLYGGTNYYFIYDSNNDGDLSDETPSVLTDQGGDVWRKTAQAFASGMEFTLASQALPPTSPGGVNNNLALWLKADAGGINWTDQTGASITVTKVGSPTLQIDAINFNPAIRNFSSSNYYDLTGTSLTTGGGDRASIAVANRTTNSSVSYILSYYETGASNNTAFGLGHYIGRPNDPFITGFNTEVGGSGDLWPLNTSSIVEATYASSVNEFYTNGFEQTLDGSSLSLNTTVGTTARVGTFISNTSESWSNDIAEVIFYNSDLNFGDRSKINSYLAIKYGITLDQSTAQDYTASDGTTQMWNKDATGASTFDNDIFGIGRDDDSALGQLKSKSVNTDAIITLLAEGESTDDSNTPANYNFTDIADLEFLTIGNNDGAATWTSTGAPTGYQILTRQWSVQETGDVGTVQLDFDVADGDFDVPALLYGATSYYFFYDSDNDGDLSDETPSVLTDQGGDVWRKTAQAFADGMEFTLASQAFDTSDAPVSYGDANHGVSSTLYLGSTAGDFDSAAINTANADGDDLSGDDEQTITFQSYLHDGGMTCVGTSGTYTTQTGEYCVVVTVNNTSGNTAQLVGWLDYDHDDAFGTAERSLSDLGGNGTGALVGNSSGGSADASYATGNILTGFSGNVVLVFTGLGDNDTQLGISSMLRLRLTSDSGSDFFTTPTPSTTVSDGEVEDQFVAFGVLPVSLTSFNSSLSGKRLNADWSTASELFNIGFQLWGLDGATNQWTALHRRVVRSRNGNSVEPQIYRKRVRLPSSISELKAIGISTLDASGEEHYYGPFEVGKSYGDLIELESISWNRIRAEMDEQMIAQGYVKNRYGYLRQRGGSPVDSDTEQSVIEVSVSADGMYELTGEMLRQAGVDVNTLTRHSTAVVDSFGNPVSRRMMAKGPWIGSDRTLGERGHIIFMGRAPKGEAALYSDVSVYRLIQDRTKVHKHQLQRRKGVSSGFSEFYYDEVMLEQQTTYNVSSQADDPWQMGSMIFARSVKPVTVMKTLSLPADVLEDKGYTLLLGLGRSSSLAPIDGDENGEQDPEHIVQGAVLSADGRTVLLDEAQAVGKGQWDIELPVMAGTRLKDEDNQAQVGGIFRPGAGYRSSLSSLDYVGLRYARAYKSKLENKYLHFTSPLDGSSGYEVEIPNGAMVSVYAVSGDNVIRIQPEKVHRYSRDGQRRALVRFAALQGLDLLEDEALHYWVSVKGGYLTPDHIEAKQLLSEASVISQATGKDYVLIAHPAFMGADSDGVEVLNDYATFKVGQGYNAAIVNYLDIVSSFGGGQAGPHGLTRYLAALSALGSLKHTVLVGGGSYDYLDYLGSGGHSFIPSYYRLAGDVRYTATDAPYVQDEQGIMLSSVGRLPVRELSELRFLVDKTISWGNREASAAQVLLLAENKDKRHDFKGSANSLSGILAHESNQISIYIDDLLIDNPELSEAEVIALAKSQLLDNINEGIDQIIYVGHSSPDRLMKKNIFNATDAGLLGEANPNMWLSLACYVTYYESTHVNTLAHQLLFSGNAVNITGPMYLSSLGDNEAYARGIINGMNAGKPIGESVGDVKEASSNQSMIINWSLLGDPTNLLTN